MKDIYLVSINELIQTPPWTQAAYSSASKIKYAFHIKLKYVTKNSAFIKAFVNYPLSNKVKFTFFRKMYKTQVASSTPRLYCKNI